MTGCGNTAENNSPETADNTNTVSEAETTAEESAPDTGEETAEPEEDSIGDEDLEAGEQFIPVTYEGDFEYNGVTFKTMADVFAASGDDPNVGSSGNQFINPQNSRFSYLLYLYFEKIRHIYKIFFLLNGIFHCLICTALAFHPKYNKVRPVNKMSVSYLYC